MTNSELKNILSRINDTTEFLGVDLVDVNQHGIFYNTPIAVAISWNDQVVVEKLISFGANVNEKNENGETALHRAVLFENSEIAAIIIEHGADKGIRNNDGLTPLEYARELGNTVMTQLLDGIRGVSVEGAKTPK